jgi:hypothetical protein
MTNSKNTAGESGSSKSFLRSVTAIAICAVLATGAAVMLMPASATSNVSSNNGASAAAGEGYLPAQYVNQAVEREPTKDYSYN